MRRRDILFILLLSVAICAVVFAVQARPEASIPQAPERPAAKSPPPPQPEVEPVHEVAAPEAGMVRVTFRARASGEDVTAGCSVAAFVANRWTDLPLKWLQPGPGLHSVGLQPVPGPLQTTIWRHGCAPKRVILAELQATTDLGEFAFEQAAHVEVAGALQRAWPPPVWGDPVHTPTIERGWARLPQGRWLVSSLDNGELLRECVVDNSDCRTLDAPRSEVAVSVECVNRLGVRFPAECTCEWQSRDGRWIAEPMHGATQVPRGARVRLRARAQHIADAVEVIDEFVANSDEARELTVTSADKLVIRVTRQGLPAPETCVWICTGDDGAGYADFADANGEVSVPLEVSQPQWVCEWPKDDAYSPLRLSHLPAAWLPVGALVDGANQRVLELGGSCGTVDLTRWMGSLGPGRQAWSHTISFRGAGVRVRGLRGTPTSLAPGRYALCSSFGPPLHRFAVWEFEVAADAALRAPEAALHRIDLETLPGFGDDLNQLYANILDAWQPAGWVRGPVSLSPGDYELRSDGHVLAFSVQQDGAVQCASAGVFGEHTWRVRHALPWPCLHDIALRINGADYKLAADAPWLEVTCTGNPRVGARGFTVSVDGQEVILTPEAGGVLVRLPAVPLTSEATGSLHAFVDGAPRTFQLYQQEGVPLVLVPWIEPGLHEITIEGAGWTWKVQAGVHPGSLSELTCE